MTRLSRAKATTSVVIDGGHCRTWLEHPPLEMVRAQKNRVAVARVFHILRQRGRLNVVHAEPKRTCLWHTVSGNQFVRR
jgi:hypothetical protein